jgi:hypothetical protein
MEKEEFLAMSLPYGLKGIIKGKENVCGSFIYKLYSCNSETNVVELVGETNLKTDEFKPVLHKLSDLTKEIEHNGEKFVPIIELARTGFDVCDDFEIKTRSKEGISGCMFSDSDGIMSVFAYHYDRESFGAHLCDDGSFITVYNQFIMFQKLIELHFDLAGLIDKGKAIDVNTLKINPYK